jgi:hypothetical protein
MYYGSVRRGPAPSGDVFAIKPPDTLTATATDTLTATATATDDHSERVDTLKTAHDDLKVACETWKNASPENKVHLIDDFNAKNRRFDQAFKALNDADDMWDLRVRKVKLEQALANVRRAHRMYWDSQDTDAKNEFTNACVRFNAAIKEYDNAEKKVIANGTICIKVTRPGSNSYFRVLHEYSPCYSIELSVIDSSPEFRKTFPYLMPVLGITHVNDVPVTEMSVYESEAIGQRQFRLTLEHRPSTMPIVHVATVRGWEKKIFAADMTST